MNEWEDGKLLTTKEVAEKLKIAERTARVMIARGDIVGHKPGERAWRVDAAALLGVKVKKVGRPKKGDID